MDLGTVWLIPLVVNEAFELACELDFEAGFSRETGGFIPEDFGAGIPDFGILLLFAELLISPGSRIDEGFAVSENFTLINMQIIKKIYLPMN